MKTLTFDLPDNADVELFLRLVEAFGGSLRTDSEEPLIQHKRRIQEGVVQPSHSLESRLKELEQMRAERKLFER